MAIDLTAVTVIATLGANAWVMAGGSGGKLNTLLCLSGVVVGPVEAVLNDLDLPDHLDIDIDISAAESRAHRTFDVNTTSGERYTWSLRTRRVRSCCPVV